MTTDQQALGIVSWLSGLLTIIGLVFAIWQIRKALNAATAAELAARSSIAKFKDREAIFELTSVHTEISKATNYMVLRNVEPTRMCVDRAHAQIIQAQELVSTHPEHRLALTKLAGQLKTQSLALMAMTDQDINDINNMPIVFNLKKAGDRLLIIVAKLRYEYQQEQVDDHA